MLSSAQLKALTAPPTASPEALVEDLLALYEREGFYPVSWRNFSKNLQEYVGIDKFHGAYGKAFDKFMRPVKNQRGIYVRPGDSPLGQGQPARPLNTPAYRQSKPSGVSWAPQVLSPNPGKESWYGGDAGLRRLAVAQSKCFGGWSDSDFSCSSCPLARWCQEAALAKLDELARALDKEEEVRLSQAQPAQVQPAQVQPAQNMATPSPVQAQVQPPKDPLPGGLDPEEVVRNLSAGGASIVPMPFRGVCTGCEGEAPAGESMVYIRGKGMFHPECAKATL